MEHLALEIFDLDTADGRKAIGSKYVNLPENASITITDTSEIFASGDVWSHSFTLNIPANLHIFGTAGDIHGSRLHEQINKRRARLWVEGLPLFLGYLKLDDDVEVDAKGNIDVTFESGQKTFEEMIEGAKANQVPMMSDVRFGVALWRKRWVSYGLELEAAVKFSGFTSTVKAQITHDVTPYGQSHGDKAEIQAFTVDGESEGNAVQQYPRMVFPKGEFASQVTGVSGSVNELNTDYPYSESADGTPSHPYCNVALCYQRTAYKTKNEKGEEIPNYDGQPEAWRGYEYMPANRVNSAPNFFVLYWLRCLMKHLGIYVEENQMLDVEDLRRLFFVNTKCAYVEPEKLRTGTVSSRFKKYKFGSAGRLVAENFRLSTDETGYSVPASLVKGSDSDTEKRSGFQVLEYEGGDNPTIQTGMYVPDEEIPTIESISINIKEVNSWSADVKNRYVDQNSYLHDAIATSDCFPDVDISEVIEAIENGFGVRFLFSDDYKRVRVVLLRNVFRSNESQELKCEIISDSKEENSIRGFRMTYGDSDDTTFYYKGFADKLTHQSTLWPDVSDTHDYSHWNLNAEYAKLIQKASAFDKTCYVTPITGNAYGIKVDKDAKLYNELHPSTFEYAGYMDAEDGDCTGEEATIKTINVGFTPAIMNDLNMDDERKGSTRQRFALFVDETMRPRREALADGTDYNNSDAVYDVDTDAKKSLYGTDSPAKNMKSGGVVKPGEFCITSDTFASQRNLKAQVSTIVDAGSYYGTYTPVSLTWNLTGINIEGHINEGYRLYLQDNYEPNDDGVSPIETHDWGLTLGIMRGSGSDAYVAYEPDTIDNENPKNDTWDIVSGSSVTAHPDTCDNYGNLWDYDIEAGRRYLAEYLTAAGWSVTAAVDGMASCTYHFLLDGVDFLCTPIKYTRPGAHPDWNPVLTKAQLEAYVTNLWNEHGWNFGEYDSWKIVLSAKNASGNTAYADGRFSLKLRAEKPNPNFNPALEENNTTNRRYLEITNPNLRGRGLCDQFYKEYSYWIRNARIVKRTVRMELAQLLAIDKTKRVTVGDVTGFIRKMQYSVSNQTGLGNVTMEIMYI